MVFTMLISMVRCFFPTWLYLCRPNAGPTHYRGSIFYQLFNITHSQHQFKLSKRRYLAWNCTCALRDITDEGREQKLLPSWKQNCNSCYEKYHVVKEQIYRKWMSAKFWIKFKFLENLRKPLTLKSTRKRIEEKRKNGRDEGRKPNDSSCRGKPNKHR